MDEVDVSTLRDGSVKPAAPKPLATAANLGKELCDALGLDCRRVMALELRVASGDLATVTVTEHFTHCEGGLVAAALLKRRFRLVADGEAQRVELTPAGSESAESSAPRIPQSRAD